MTTNQIAAFFDLDGTLFDGYVWRALQRHHEAHRFKLPTLYAYLLSHIALWPLKNARLVSEEFFYRAWGKNMAWLVRGVQIERAQAIWEWVTDHEILPNLRPEMRNALARHRAEGHRVVLLSGTFQPLLEVVTARLGADGAVGTPLAQRNGRYLGRIIPPLGVGAGKALRMRQYADGHGIDLKAAFVYTDAFTDAPALEMVGHPVAVYPDARLAALAVERGWPVIGTVTKERE
ncbi:MAG: HAD family hydrolase [Anaerolineales bacterium]